MAVDVLKWEVAYCRTQMVVEVMAECNSEGLLLKLSDSAQNVLLEWRCRSAEIARKIHLAGLTPDYYSLSLWKDNQELKRTFLNLN